MDFSFSAEQKMLQESVRSFLEKNCSTVFVREMREDSLGHSPALWKKMADMGWQGVLVPEQYGGSGGNSVDLMVFCEEAGRALLPGPFLSTAVIAATLILDGGRQPLKDELLPRIAEGDEIVGDALFDTPECDPVTIATVARTNGGGYTISGRKLFARDVLVANHLVVLARTGNGRGESDLSVFLVDARAPGISSVPLKSFAGDRPYDLTLSDVQVPEGNLLGELGHGWELLRPALRLARLGVSSEMVGVGQKVLELSVDYAKVRQQFGRPIGSFQAIQHRLAEMYINVDSARLMVHEAGAMLAAGEECDLELAMAKAYSSDMCYWTVHEGHHIHAGNSFMKIHDMHLYLGRAKYGETAYGDPDQARAMVADLGYMPPHPLGEGRKSNWREPVPRGRG